MMDYPIRYRLRRIGRKWYVETTKTIDDRVDTPGDPLPKQVRYFTPLAEVKGAMPNGTLLKDAGRTTRGGRNLYQFEELNPDPALAYGFGKPWVAIWGDEPGIMSEEIYIPEPKTKRPVRWYRGHWQEQLKSGWRDIPHEWIDDPDPIKPVIDKNEIPPGAVERGWSSRLRDVDGVWHLEFASTDLESPKLHVSLMPFTEVHDPTGLAWDTMPLQSMGSGRYHGKNDLRAVLGQDKSARVTWDIDVPKPAGVRNVEWHNGGWGRFEKGVWLPLRESLWRYNDVTGLWVHERNVSRSERDQWLERHQHDEPRVAFTLSYTMPKGKPGQPAPKVGKPRKSKKLTPKSAKPSPKSPPRSKPKSAPKPPEETELPVGIVPLAGADGWEPAEPHAGHVLFTTEPESGTLQAVLIQGPGTPFDGKPGVKLRWITGPSKDQKEDLYGRSFWRVSDEVPRVAKLQKRADAGPKPYVVTIHGDLGRGNIWKQINVISDGSVTVFHMTPAVLGGWKLKERKDSSPEDWEDMSAESILDFMLRRPVPVYQATDSERTYVAEQLGLKSKPVSKPKSAKPAPKSPPRSPVRFTGQKVALIPGYQLAPSSVRKCLGPRVIRQAIEDALGGRDVPEAALEKVSRRIAKLTDSRVVHSTDIQDALDELGAALDVSDVFVSAGLARASEDNKLLRFSCPGDVAVPNDPPSSGIFDEMLRWSLARVGMDPDLAPALKEALLVETPRNALGEIAVEELEDVLKGKFAEDFKPDDWFFDLTSYLMESSAVLEGVTPGSYWLVPPADLPRTSENLARFFVEARRRWERIGDMHPEFKHRRQILADYEFRAIDYANQKGKDFAQKVQEQMAPRLMIQQPDAFDVLTRLEGAAWEARQSSNKLEDPHGFFANLAVFKIIRGMGERAKGLTVADMVPGAGLIVGDQGRAYLLLPDGEIMLDSSTAQPEFVRSATKTLRAAE